MSSIIPLDTMTTQLLNNLIRLLVREKDHGPHSEATQYKCCRMENLMLRIYGAHKTFTSKTPFEKHLLYYCNDGRIHLTTAMSQ